MIKFLESNTSILNYDTNIVRKAYTLSNDENIIGYATINKDENNLMFIYVLPKYRGYGYGQILFDEVLLEVQKLKYEKVYCTFSKNNMQMVRIMQKRKATWLGSNKEKVKYVINLTHKANDDILKNSDDER